MVTHLLPLASSHQNVLVAITLSYTQFVQVLSNEFGANLRHYFLQQLQWDAIGPVSIDVVYQHSL